MTFSKINPFYDQPQKNYNNNYSHTYLHTYVHILINVYIKNKKNKLIINLYLKKTKRNEIRKNMFQLIEHRQSVGVSDPYRQTHTLTEHIDQPVVKLPLFQIIGMKILTLDTLHRGAKHTNFAD